MPGCPPSTGLHKNESTYRVLWREEFPTSVYATGEANGLLYVGGSDWDRRNVPYSKDIASNSQGILSILNEQRETLRELALPSMVYSIQPVAPEAIFVGCKGQCGSRNIIDADGEILRQENDEEGEGIYNALHLPELNEIVCTTRRGMMEFLNDQTLELNAVIQLAGRDVRLWSLCCNDEHIFAGDYSGSIYKVERTANDVRQVMHINLRDAESRHPLINEGFRPSVWGLDCAGDQIIAGTRWNQIAVLNDNLNLQELRSFHGSITSLIADESNLLIGTRNGTLFNYDPEAETSEEIINEPPELQRENAIWGIANSARGALVCIADGIVCEVSTHE